jgi:hypothetical protein
MAKEAISTTAPARAMAAATKDKKRIIGFFPPGRTALRHCDDFTPELN